MSEKELDTLFDDFKVWNHWMSLQLTYKYGNANTYGPRGVDLTLEEFRTKKMSGHNKHKTYLENWKEKYPHILDKTHKHYGKNIWGWYRN